MTLTFQNDIQLLVGLVGVQETAVLTGNQRLERQLAARGTYGLACEHLTLDGHRSHRKLMLDDLTYLTYTHCLEVLAFLNGLNLFHNSYSFYWLFT